jgi:hypothetical protein
MTTTTAICGNRTSQVSANKRSKSADALFRAFRRRPSTEWAPMSRPAFVLFFGLVFIAGHPTVPSPPTTNARIVEVHALPTCAGLDCPPWPMPLSVDVCLEIDGAYLTAMYRPWGVPWATSGEKLLERKGQSIEVVLTAKHIQVVSPRFNTRLIRMHDYRVFSSPLCNAS